MKPLMHTILCTIVITTKMLVACVVILLLFSCLKTLGWDIIALWIMGGGVLICSFYIIVFNWIMLVSSLTTHRFHSAVPLIGSVSGVIGLLLIPVSMPHYSIYLLPVLLDWGTIVFFISLPRLINDLFFTSYTGKTKQVDFYLSSSDYQSFETPRACSIVREVDIPVFSGKGLLVEITPPIIGQPYGFGGDDIHLIVLTPRFEGVSLSLTHEWPCQVHILCSSIIVNGEEFPDASSVLHIAWGEISQSKRES